MTVVSGLPAKVALMTRLGICVTSLNTFSAAGFSNIRTPPTAACPLLLQADKLLTDLYLDVGI